MHDQTRTCLPSGTETILCPAISWAYPDGGAVAHHVPDGQPAIKRKPVKQAETLHQPAEKEVRQAEKGAALPLSVHLFSVSAVLFPLSHPRFSLSVFRFPVSLFLFSVSLFLFPVSRLLFTYAPGLATSRLTVFSHPHRKNNLSLTFNP